MIKEVIILCALIALCVSLPTTELKQSIAPAVKNSPIVILPESNEAHEDLETAETAHHLGHHHHHHHHHHGHGYGHGHGHGYGGYGRGGFSHRGFGPVHHGGLGGGVGVGVGVAVGVGVGGFVGRK